MGAKKKPKAPQTLRRFEAPALRSQERAASLPKIRILPGPQNRLTGGFLSRLRRRHEHEEVVARRWVGPLVFAVHHDVAESCAVQHQ